MKLKEKIYYCRKKSGLSQEALAEQLRVSRQAVSKWETGESVPEIDKLARLSSVFDVTVDWLLSEEEPEEPQQLNAETMQSQSANSNIAESSLGVLGRMIRKYGWVYGVIVAVVGLLFTGIGCLAKFLIGRMFSSNSTDMFYAMDEMYPQVSSNNPVSIMGTVFIVIGSILMVAGIILAIVLKAKAKKK